MKNFYIKLYFIYIIFFYFTPVHSEELEIGISQGSIKPTPIAITDFYSQDLKASKVGKDISMVISNNLEGSGLFVPKDKDSFIQDNDSLNNKNPRFEDWKIIKAQHLVAGTINIEKESIRIEFRLYDVLTQKQITGKRYETSLNNWRRVAHIVSDEIFERITGEGGYFDTRIVYVAESGPVGKKQKRLAIMDQDQSNHRF